LSQAILVHLLLVSLAQLASLSSDMKGIPIAFSGGGQAWAATTTSASTHPFAHAMLLRGGGKRSNSKLTTGTALAASLASDGSVSGIAPSEPSAAPETAAIAASMTRTARSLRPRDTLSKPVDVAAIELLQPVKRGRPRGGRRGSKETTARADSAEVVQVAPNGEVVTTTASRGGKPKTGRASGGKRIEALQTSDGDDDVKKDPPGMNNAGQGDQSGGRETRNAGSRGRGGRRGGRGGGRGGARGAHGVDEKTEDTDSSCVVNSVVNTDARNRGTAATTRASAVGGGSRTRQRGERSGGRRRGGREGRGLRGGERGGRGGRGGRRKGSEEGATPEYELKNMAKEAQGGTHAAEERQEEETLTWEEEEEKEFLELRKVQDKTTAVERGRGEGEGGGGEEGGMGSRGDVSKTPAVERRRVMFKEQSPLAPGKLSPYLPSSLPPSIPPSLPPFPPPLSLSTPPLSPSLSQSLQHR
jgi:hypothetical protein